MIVEMKRKASTESTSSYEVDRFKNQTSSFGKYEEEALKIKIVEVASYEKIFGPISIDLPDYLQHMELPDFDYDKVLTFKPSEYPDFTDAQCLLLTKLKYRVQT
ncbi:hypothetical protein K450DRAFT_276119 [Umbelopsis ramanniana AG]|uniref:Uncharacterized protein n=1 Tax=Umbelopsis ramanniana AG TaxID=1314678 RepID=A0AAD5E121_UMBRA|nr:uncharacterized protein K450DRAFT_276119 [Umbelopsis ramanniana AG]KAI8574884.1 hypothetical protein K450DRAFT_276119 [Umbelopsis ramanniana AG]